MTTIEEFKVKVATLSPMSGAIEELRQGGEYPRLLIAVDRGRFTVTAFMGPNDVYDKVGDGSREGELTINLGGQSTEWPARLILEDDQVVVACSLFVETGEVNLADGWLRQGSDGWE